MSRRGLIAWLAAAVTLTGVLVAVVAVPGAGAGGCDSPPFPDVATSNEFCADISWLSSQKITTGYGDGDFHPTRLVTRQEMAAFLYRYKNPASTPAACASAPFNDVPAGSEFCGEIQWLSKQGIASGYGDGTFHPKAPIAREEMASFLYKLAVTTPGNTPCDTALFSDVTSTNPFCAAITWLAQNHITNGYGTDTFAPTLFVARQEMAAFLHRLAEEQATGNGAPSGGGSTSGSGGGPPGGSGPGSQPVVVPLPTTLEPPPSLIQSVTDNSDGTQTVVLGEPTATIGRGPNDASARPLTTGAPAASGIFGNPCQFFGVINSSGQLIKTAVAAPKTPKAQNGVLILLSSAKPESSAECGLTGPRATLDEAFSQFEIPGTSKSIGSQLRASIPRDNPFGCTGGAQLSVAASADIGDITATFSFSLLHRSMEFKLSDTPKLRLTMSADGKADCTPDLSRFKITIPIWDTPPLDLILTPEFTYTFNGHATATITWSPVLTLGFSYADNKGNKPHDLTAFRAGTLTHAVTADLNAIAELGVSVGLTLAGGASLIGTIGPRVHVEETGGCLTISTDIHAELTATVNVLIKKWHWTLAGYGGPGQPTMGSRVLYAQCPIIANTGLPDGYIGVAYTDHGQPVELTTDDHRQGTWTQIGLPPGLSLSGYTIVGRPTTAGTYQATVTFTDTQGNAPVSKTFTITVRDPGAPVITTTTLPDATVGQPYSTELTTADHRTGTWTTDGALPAGLSLSGYTISGTPTTSGDSTFGLTFTDTRGRTATAAASLRVLPNIGSWTAVNLPPPSGDYASRLLAVSCSSATTCTAVGTSYNGAGGHPLIETLSAGVWKPLLPPLPPGMSGGDLFAVSCATATTCTAAGEAENSAGPVALVETLSDGSWTDIIPPLPADSDSNYGSLNAVSCASATACTAVGGYESGGYGKPLVETLAAGAWMSSAPPLPSVGTFAAEDGGLYGVSCAAVDTCTAVGFYFDPSTPNSYALAESLAAGVWTPSTPPSPPGSKNMALSSVSCPTPVACIAVGSFDSGNGSAIAETLATGTWTPTILPPPASNNGISLTSVSCISNTVCTAAGAVNEFSGDHALADTMIDATWLPTQLSSPAASSDSINGVSCVSATRCTAVGASSGTGGDYALVESR